MKATFRVLAKPGYFVLALMVAFCVILPVIGGKAYAIGEVTTRSIDVSTSAAGTAATYKVTFNPATTSVGGPTDVEAVVLNFCDDTPLIGTGCEYTAGQSLNDLGTLTITAITGTSDTTIGGGHWTIGVGTQNDTNTTGGVVVVLKDATAGDTVSSATPVSFTITGLVNPAYTTTGICATANQPNCSYYARIITYSGTAATVSSDYFANNITDTGAIVPIDAGGIALSTAAQITVTAKVQEQLAFCVWDDLATGQVCGASNTAPAITLGNSNGVLSSSNAYANNDTTYSVQTNAGSGAAVMIIGTTLTNGSYSIAAMTTEGTSTRGTAQFGLCTYESSGANLTFTGGSMSGDYNGGATAGHLCSNTADGAGATSGTSGTGVGDAGAEFYLGSNGLTGGSTFGDQIASESAGPVSNGQIAFMANIPVTQEPGVYTSNLSLIANGTY